MQAHLFKRPTSSLIANFGIRESHNASSAVAASASTTMDRLNSHNVACVEQSLVIAGCILDLGASRTHGDDWFHG